MGSTYQAVKVNPNILEMEYAVRGPIPQRAAVLKNEGKKVIFCNIGNPQALGQSPVTYYRQVLSLVEDPMKIRRERQLKALFEETPVSDLREGDFISDDVLDLSEEILERIGTGLGAYTESKGIQFVREAVARFIDRRDSIEPSRVNAADPEKIFLTDGASGGVKAVIDLLISGSNDGIMIPIPQYPLYSAAIKKSGGVQVNYFPDEDQDWTLNREMLEESLNQAKAKDIQVKGIVVINPGNPTGALLHEQNIQDIIDFARRNSLVILADEVYQENIYTGEFVSFAKALGTQDVPLFSMHSISKGFYGECGHRGGYLEVRNPPQVQGTDLDFVDLLLKQASVSLCANTAGQLLVYLMVCPPEEGSQSYERFIREKQHILTELHEKASMIREAFNHMEGVSCFGHTGGMYLFPRLSKLPPGTDDFDYCMALLEETGLCVVNGAGFGQRAGTHHLRVAFLPPKDLLAEVLPQWIKFHNAYVNAVPES
jgi:aspartate/methionine/tyrosine aminotransferase